MSENIEEYLERGLYGTQETKQAERKYFLTALRERIEVALTKGQVMKPTVYKEAERTITNVQNGQVFLNGTIAYSFLSKYIQIANKHNVPFTIVQNLEADTDIGLVVTGSKGSTENEIFIEN
ncbi:YueI family protein [Priestia flexa]|uniref:YueI family protein n=1 Tax=Priestia flexa TaxID=86664 RepID=UPI0032EF9C2E